MKPEQLQTGALVYDTHTGQLYRLLQRTEVKLQIGGPYIKWTCVLIGCRGEESRAPSIVEDRSMAGYVLWCERCDGSGDVDTYKPYCEQCPDCNGEGLIR